MVRPRDWVERHDARRRASIPTVSVLLGPAASARAALAKCKQGFVWIDHDRTSPDEWVRAWDEAHTPSVFASARASCALALGLSTDTLDTAHGALGRAALEGHFTARLRGTARALLADPPAPPSRALLPGVVALHPAATLRGLALQPHALEEVAPALLRLAEQAPALPLALVSSPVAWTKWRDRAPERQRVLLEEGLVHLEPEPASPAKPPDRTARTLEALGAPAATRDLATALRRAETSGDEARSLAERLLFEALELMPRTRGRFALNQALPIRFGPRDMEVDLLSRGDRIALEVDGYYHFREPEDFRRDRRKDLLLQKAGWLVVRVLADDVADRLDEILDLVEVALDRPEKDNRR